MPSSVNISGKRKYDPGFYGEVDASALGGSGISTGNVAVLGVFPSLQAATPTWVSNAPACAALDPSNADFALIGKLAFAPSIDAKVRGGADNLCLVNVQPNTQAKVTINDSAGNPSIIVRSRLWGPAGNRTFLTLKTDAAGEYPTTATVIRDGVTEEFAGVESGPVGTLQYTGEELHTVTLESDPSTFRVKWTRRTSAFPGAGNASAVDIASGGDMVSAGGVLGFTASVAADAAISITLTGLDATGAPLGGGAGLSVTIPSGSVAKVNTSVGVSRIDGVTMSTTDLDFEGYVTINGIAFDFDTALSTAADILTIINQNVEANFEAEAVHVRAGGILGSDLDAMADVDIKTNAGTLRADTWAILAALNTSRMVDAVRHTLGTLPPSPVGAEAVETVRRFLVGGTVTSPVTTAHWDAAFRKIAGQDVQIVVPLTTTLAVLKLSTPHCIMSALLGFERNVWVGTTVNLSLSAAFSTYTSKLNSRYVSVVTQGVKVDHPNGTQPVLGPEWYALIHAAMQAGTPVGTPLTGKRPDIVETVQVWDTVLDIDDAIKKGLCVTKTDNLGLKVARSVTCHLSDDNPNYSEMSAFESAQTSVRRLRAVMNDKIGDPISAAGVSAKQLLGIAVADLEAQVNGPEPVLKAWRNARFEDMGDRMHLVYDLAAIEPLNFITAKANVVRIPQSA